MSCLEKVERSPSCTLKPAYLVLPTTQEFKSFVANTEAQNPIPRTTSSTTLSIGRTLLSCVKRKEKVRQWGFTQKVINPDEMQDFQFPQSTDFPVQCLRLLTFRVESPSPYALFLFCPITKLLILSDSINKKKKKIGKRQKCFFD